jgi:hypothetical protein
MKTLLLPLILAAAIGCVRASENEGLFIPNRQIEPKYEIEKGEIVMRLGAERLKLTQAVLRYDTEDRKKFWLELDFTKWADPGDFYVFTIGGRSYSGFTVRGEGTNERGGRWAFGLTDVEAGRELLTKIATAYDLPAVRTLDQTKSEQAGAGQPATRPVVKPEGGDKPQPEAEGRSR